MEAAHHLDLQAMAEQLRGLPGAIHMRQGDVLARQGLHRHQPQRALLGQKAFQQSAHLAGRHQHLARLFKLFFLMTHAFRGLLQLLPNRDLAARHLFLLQTLLVLQRLHGHLRLVLATEAGGQLLVARGDPEAVQHEPQPRHHGNDEQAAFIERPCIERATGPPPAQQALVPQGHPVDAVSCRTHGAASCLRA